jgi:hypothetical protein
MNAITMSRPALVENEPNRDDLGWLQRRSGERYTDMVSMREALAQRSRFAKSDVIRNRELEFVAMNPQDIQSKDDANRLLVKAGDRVVGMSHWSFGQAATLAGAPAGYLRTLPAPLVSDVLNYGMRYNRDVERVMVYGDASNLRAVTGPTYGRVSDHEVVEAVRTVLDDGSWQPAEQHMGLQATDRSLQMFLIDKANPVEVGRTFRGGSDILYRGLRISNSELGYSSLKVEGFLFRSYCLNGMIFGKTEVGAISMKHSKNAPFRWAREIQPAIEAYVREDGSKLVEQVARLKATNIAHDNEGAVNWLKKRGVTGAFAKQALERNEAEEGLPMRTVWDAIQGITAAARSIHTVEERSDMEKLAGDFWTKVAA